MEDGLTRVALVLLVAFPYLLFRFGASFRRRARGLEGVALAVTVGLATASFAFRRLPGPEDPWAAGFVLYVAVLLVQWVALTAVVAIELWRAGRGQPTVSRRRMRLLSVATTMLTLALVLTTLAGGGGNDTASLALRLFALAVAPLFLLGFAPPGFVLAAWRQPQLEELRAAEEVLLRAVSPKEVGDRLLPHVTRIIGGDASALFDGDGAVLGVDGVTAEEASRFDGDHDQLITLPVRTGRLVVRVSPYAPYFGRSEHALLEGLATFTDLALSRAELSERERETARELQASNDAMREFVAIASHDLRTPVTVINGFASTLETDWEQLPDAQRRQFLGTIRRHAEHLGVIIDDLLTTSRLDAGVLERDPQDVELAPFLRQLIDDLRFAAGVTIDVPAGATAHVDVEHLKRMVTNYLVNALRYGAPPVSISAVPSGEVVDVIVSDLGEGVPTEFEERIFEKFARADQRMSRDNQGTGLGLTIVRGLARASGGEAWYERNVPSGARFGIRLPAGVDASR